MNKKLINKILFIILCFTCAGIYNNYIYAGASKGNVTATTRKNEIEDCKGSGTLVIGKNIEKISLLGVYADDSADITEFKVAKGNKYFSAVDGVLFNKNKTKLLYYPNARKNKSYTVKSGVNTICSEAFCYNKYLENVNIKNGVQSIEGFAFLNSKVRSVSIPASVKKIGTSVLECCENLEEVLFNASVTSIPQYMFYGCKSLKTIDLPDYITEIGICSFSRCENMEVYIGKNISNISTDAFKEAAVSFEVDKENKLYTSIDGVLYTKDGKTLEYYPCSRKGAYIMPDTVTGFEDFAEPLAYNENLTEITLGDGMEEMDIYELYGCTNLEKIILSRYTKNVITTGKYTPVWGLGLKNLKEITVPEDNKYYSSYKGNLYSKDYSKLCFVASGRSHLILHTDVNEIPYNITGQNKFEKIELPDSNKYFTVKDNILYDKELTKIIIFPGIITSYEVPATVSDISVILNEYCTEIEEEGFIKRNDMAYDLEKITVEKDSNYFKSKDGVLFSKDMTQLVLYPQKRKGAYIVPESVTTFDAGVFASATGLTELVLQTGGMIDLNGCTSLKKLTYTEGVKRVCVWGHCNSDEGLQLEEIYLPGSIRYLSLIRIGNNTTVYGYKNTLETDYYFEQDFKASEDIKTYVKKLGYKFKSLGTAPEIVKNVKAVKNADKIKLTWNVLPGADGYIITYSQDFYGNRNEVIIKNIKNSKKKSYNLEKNILKDKGYIRIRAYKNINGIKVYGKSVWAEV